MFKRTTLLLAAASLTTFISSCFAINLGYETDEILVRFAPDANSKSLHVAQRDSILASVGVGQVKRSLKSVPDLSLVALPAGVSVSDAIKALEGKTGVLHAQPNFIYRACSTFPDDSYFSALWGMHNTGQTGGTVDADIDAPEAWDIITDSNVIVAVIDTGIDYMHPDLAANMWVNEAENQRLYSDTDLH